MPLPEGGTQPWPPPHVEPINQQYAVWAAWWAGDVDQLAGIYGGGSNGGRDTTGFFASEGGGFKATARRAIDTVRRWFWGDRRSGASSPRQRLHVPLAGDIAATSADLLFADPPTLTAATVPSVGPDGKTTEKPDERAQARLDDLWQDDTHAVLLEAAEICSGLGGVYLRLVWGSARPHPWITAVQPDVAVPEWQWGKLAAVTFWREVGRKSKTVWRHLERHEPGKVLHGLYQGTVEELGQLVPLTDHPATSPLADDRLVNGNEIPTGTMRLTAVYVPNVKPNRVWRNLPEAAPLGRPDIAGCEPLLDALDLTWSSWIRDVDLGKARLVVPREYMQSQGPGQGATVDLDQEIYEPVGAMASESGDKMQIELIQPTIRVAEHQASVDALKREIITSAGYAPGSLGSGAVDGQAVTATEIASRDRRSIVTTARKIRYLRSELGDLLETWTEVDAYQYKSGIRPQRPVLERPEPAEDPLQQAQTLRELHTAEAISIEGKVRRLHPDWPDEQVDEEVERIREDYGVGQVEDPGTFTGGPGGPLPGTPPGDPPQE